MLKAQCHFNGCGITACVLYSVLYGWLDFYALNIKYILFGTGSVRLTGKYFAVESARWQTKAIWVFPVMDAEFN